MSNEIQQPPFTLTRRQFMGQASCAALGTTGLFSTLLNLRLTRAAYAQESLPDDDYKALVCIFQAGGNDSYNMLVPTNTADYNQYLAVRGNVALEKAYTASKPFNSGILDINALGTGGRTYGVHPAMSEVQQLFNDGHLAFMANTGTLVEPLTVAQFKNKSRLIPRALFSHNDQIMQWQTTLPLGTPDSGWAGRMADIMQMQSNSMAQVAMNISLSGNNIMQTGRNTTHYSITSDGSVSLLGKNSPVTSVNGLQYQIVGSSDDDENSLAGQMYRNRFMSSYMSEFRKSVALDLEFADAFDGASLSTQFDANNPLALNLRAVAKTIAARDSLNMRRQVFFVIAGGWDHHAELVNTQYGMLKGVSSAMKQFWDALNELGVQENVVTFTASDFGRTLRTNGRGTDHAWGGNLMMMGGPVQGQRIWGNYPTAGDMQLGTGLDVGTNGRLLPTTSVDEYMAELALWFGVSPSSLNDVFPNINNFYDPSSGSAPIGFLGCDDGQGGGTGPGCSIETSLPVSAVTASSFQAANPPANTLDGSFDTRWSANGIGEWIQYELTQPAMLTSIKLAWFKGDQRTATYSVLVSSDGTNWTTVLDSAVSSGTTLALESRAVTPTEGRYVRVVGYGNSSNAWNSITETKLYGTNTSGPTPTYTHPTTNYNGTSGDTVAHSAALDVAANNADFSVEFCITPQQGPTGQWRAIVHKGDSNQHRTFAMWLRPTDMRLHYRISTSSSWNSGRDSVAALPLNQQTKVTYVREGDQLKLYLNDVLDSQVTLSGTVVSNSGTLHIGDSPWYTGTQSQISGFALYNEAITPEGGCS